MRKISVHSAILLMFLPFLLLTSCNQDSETTSKTESVAEKALTSKTKLDTLSCVCIWDKVPLRAEPRRDGKWLSSLSLGETVQWFGETAIDSSDKNREYLRIQLSDGKTGWASSYGLVKDSEVGAVKEATFLYRRPDLLTITDEKLESMDMVAVDEDKG
ncbi:MAG: SH3 domain-containing protein, partial [Aliifodinibius sp.]|nr:SH3 domain-containing protein [Fodinibius sp.]NIV12653.1 SH3 domain-containing protein [Fodinibius sp.]NIY26357.1 SH3 domain-containing protein [Fodinibius sp.]